MLFSPGSIINKVITIVFSAIVFSACASSKPYTLDPIKTFDPDNKDIPAPPKTEEHFSWETLYYSTFYQMEKPLDLGRTAQKVGQFMGISGRDEAVNINVLDEVPNSSWYTRRHYFEPMSISELKKGPNKAGGPDTNEKITVVRGKSEGVTPGFTIKDAKGNTFIIKVDNSEFPEFSSSSEVISTLIYYASGYYTPQNSIAYLNPKQLIVGDEATITKQGMEQEMSRADLDTILTKAYKREDGNLRVLASKYVEGRPMGPWSFLGTREDDPNDRIPHEDRREVRGLRVLASWLNDTDRRKANTLATYVEDGDKKFIRHYLLDMGSTLGTNGLSLRHTKRGQEYRYDLRYMALLYGTLGLYVKPWAKPEATERPFYKSVGYYESEIFSPANWVTSYPNPSFEKVTPRDGFWGAKMVMAFSDEDLQAIVEEARLSNPEAREYMIKVLKERRDKIGRYWFQKVNPLDKFSARLTGDKLVLSFADLGIDGHLFDASQTSYSYHVGSKERWFLENRKTDRPAITVDLSSLPVKKQEGPMVVKFQIKTLRDGSVSPDKKIDVYVMVDGSQSRVLGLEREN